MYRYRLLLLILFLRQLNQILSFAQNKLLVFPHTLTKRHPFSSAASIDTLVLSGGGAKGVSLVGVADVFEQCHLMNSIQHIAGTSAGAIFGALLSFGMDSKALANLTHHQSFDALLGKRIIIGNKGTVPLLTKSGLPIYQIMKNEIRNNIIHYLSKHQPNFHETAILKNIYCKALSYDPITFKDLHCLNQYFPKTFKNFYTMAMNRDTGDEVIFSHQLTPEIEVASACRASASIPVILEPHTITIKDKPHAFVDGALLSNTPFHLVPKSSKIIMVELEKKNNVNRRQSINIRSIFDYLGDKIQQITSFLVINLIGQVNHKVGYFHQRKWFEQILSAQDPKTRISINLSQIHYLDFKTARQRARSLQLISQIETAFFLSKQSLVKPEILFLYLKTMLSTIDQHLDAAHKQPDHEKVLLTLKTLLSHIFKIEHKALQNLMLQSLIYSIKTFMEAHFDSTEAKIIGGDLQPIPIRHN